MSREQLAAQARAAGQAAKHNLRWMQKHPDRYDVGKRIDMEAYLNMLIAFAEVEKMKSARRPGRTSLRNRLKYLVVSIIPQRIAMRKGGRV